MYNIGIFFGSNTGNTKKVAYKIKNKISNFFFVNILDISNVSKNDFLNYDIFILGTSTWYYGKLQYDWNIFFDSFKKINFYNKIVSFFGCGNQKEYSNCFCNGLYKLYNVVYKKNAKIIGYWPSINYNFNYSKSLLNKNYFIGLIIDEYNQSNLTDKRIYIWVSKLILDIYNII